MYGTLRKMSFHIQGHAEIHIYRSFLDNEKGMQEILAFKKPNGRHTLVPPLHIEFFLNNTKILIFGGISKLLSLGKFWQSLAILERFYYIGSG